MSSFSSEQKAAFEFLRAKWASQELFSRQEFQAATGYDDVSFKTYFSKQFKGLLVQVNGSYRVSLAFWQYASWRMFRDNVVTQNRILTRDYDRYCFEKVVAFEFFLPLRNEEYLRAALDGLFYKDSIKFRLKTIRVSELAEYFPLRTNETPDQQIERICKWIAEKFVGYSINHVSGRFRKGGLKTKQEVLEDAAKSPERYLIDETTAVVRFIFPCKVDQNSESSGSAGQSLNDPQALLDKEAELVRWVFDKLFVQSILEVVNGEVEIWLLESGMRNQLHIFSIND